MFHQTYNSVSPFTERASCDLRRVAFESRFNTLGNNSVTYNKKRQARNLLGMNTSVYGSTGVRRYEGSTDAGGMSVAKKFPGESWLHDQSAYF